ncbi:MAG: ACT domain-containing protein [Erysipelotrichaceae bacterium]
MVGKYLIVDKSILPDVFEKVVEVRELLTNGQIKGVSEAVKTVGISRSTYYKYKDFVFSPSQNTMGRKAVISLMLNHELGVLSEVLNHLSEMGANILSINQSIPINQKASVMLTVDINDMDYTIDNAILNISNINGVLATRLLSIE